MKKFNLYLIIPLLALGYASISAADAEKSVAVKERPFHFDIDDPAIRVELDRCETNFIRKVAAHQKKLMKSYSEELANEIGEACYKKDHVAETFFNYYAMTPGAMTPAIWRAIRSSEEVEKYKAATTVKEKHAADSRLEALKETVFYPYSHCVASTVRVSNPKALRYCRERLGRQINMAGLGLTQRDDAR